MMYPKFIEVHDGQGQIASVNVAHIIYFMSGQLVLTDNLGKDGVFVQESYDELKALIRDAGCLINRHDPRLDLTKPLTMDDLKGMISEPVWNSNSRQWELIKRVDELYCSTVTTGVYNHEYTEEDLIKTPLYRMRQPSHTERE